MAASRSDNSERNGRTKRISLTIAATTVFLGLAWIAFSKYAVPPLIASAYHGESLPLFNRIITGQASHPLADYLSAWQTLSWHLLIALCLAGLLGILFTQPRVQAAIKWNPSPPVNSPRILPMTWKRALAVNALIVFIVGGSLYNIAMDQQHWPFSNYPMFSWEIHAWTRSVPQLYGVTKENPLHEFPLVQLQYTQPFGIDDLESAFLTISGDDALNRRDRAQRLERAVRDCFQRYDQNRRTGRNSGPPLVTMRLYRVHWTLDPHGRKVRPDWKVLILEIKRPDIKDR